MAKLMLIGSESEVEILTDPENEELVLAVCRLHSFAGCLWRERYDTLSDAREYAERHADTGGR